MGRGLAAAWLAVLLGVLGPARGVAETWVAVCEPDYPPYNFVKDGEMTGMDAQTVAAVLGRMGAKAEFHSYPWSRAVSLTMTGGADLLFQVIDTEERRTQFLLVGPFRTGVTVAMVRAGSGVVVNGVADLAAYRLGKVRGFSYGPEIDGGGLRASSENDNESLLRMLVNRRVDVILGDRLALTWLAHRQGLADQVQVLPAVLGRVPRYFAVPRDRAAQAERLRQALAEVTADGSLDRIQKRWADGP